MKNTLKTLGIICIIAAAIFIASCGPIEPTTPSFTVTFDSDGGTPATQTQTIEQDSGDLVRLPTTTPTKKNLAEPGLYKNWPETGYELDGWYDGATKYEFNKETITSDLKLTAKWKLPAGVEDLSATGTGNDIVTKSFDAINKATITAGDKYTLYIDTNVTSTTTAGLVLNKSNTDLTIIGNNKDIKSSNLSAAPTSTNANNNVFITIGAGKNPISSDASATIDKTIKLTLKNVAILGSGQPTVNSLIRVMNGATLSLESGAYIAEHINSAGGSSGATGNGSAICIINGSTLNIAQGAVIENNQSTAAGGGTAGNNTNLVAGVYVIGTPREDPSEANKNRSTVNLTGGAIKGEKGASSNTLNKCMDGNTADLYITELVNLNLQGNVTIGELCINADNNANNTGTGTYGKYDYPTFKILGPVTNTIDKLNLRSSFGASTDSATSILAGVQGAWKDKVVFSGGDGYNISGADVAQFKLWEFTGRKSLRADTGTDETKWANWINPEKWGIDIDNNQGIFKQK